MRIEVIGGSISFERGTIGRLLGRAQFLDSPVGQSAKEGLVNEEWRHYHIEPEEGIAGTALFRGDRLDRIFLTMRIPSDKTEEWNVASELERKEKHDTWLRAELGAPPYKYDWGSVASEFDAKGLASEIIVTYAK